MDLVFTWSKKDKEGTYTIVIIYISLIIRDKVGITLGK